MTDRHDLIGEKKIAVDDIGLTVVTLKEYVEARLSAMDRTTDLASQIDTTKICNIEKDVKHLITVQAQQEGKASQNAMIVTLVISVIGALTGIAGILIALIK